ncbi:MAG: NAD-dependent epimerase/dehydratase family protein [Thermodesulfovibrionales bacterium]
MKILITGNMGYVGPCVVERLRSSYPGAALIGLDTGFFASCLTRRLHSPRVSGGRPSISGMCERPERVSSKGWTPSFTWPPFQTIPWAALLKVTLDINYRTSVALAKSAKEAGVKAFVYASSCSMYGCADDSPRRGFPPPTPYRLCAVKVYAEKSWRESPTAPFTVTSHCALPPAE